jgi:hypothetical protein
MGIDRGSIVKVGKFKWEVFKKVDDYNYWAYKGGTAKKKAYLVNAIDHDGNFEVWQTGGSGQKLKDKPEVSGKMTIIKEDSLIDKYIIEAGKQCFHCKSADAAPKKGVCQKCSTELEAWRNKKNKKQSDK